MKTYLNFTKRFFFPLLLASILFVVSSLFWTSDFVSSYDEVSRIHLGFPLAFTTMDFTQRYDADAFSLVAKNGSQVKMSFGVGFLQIISWFGATILLIIPYLYAVMIDSLATGSFSFGSGWVLGISSWHILLADIVVVQLAFATLLFFVYSLFPNTQRYFQIFSIRNISIGIVVVIIAVYGIAWYQQSRVSPGMFVTVSPIPAPTIPVPATARD